MVINNKLYILVTGNVAINASNESFYLKFVYIQHKHNFFAAGQWIIHLIAQQNVS